MSTPSSATDSTTNAEVVVTQSRRSARVAAEVENPVVRRTAAHQVIDEKLNQVVKSSLVESEKGAINASKALGGLGVGMIPGAGPFLKPVYDSVTDPIKERIQVYSVEKTDGSTTYLADRLGDASKPAIKGSYNWTQNREGSLANAGNDFIESLRRA